MFSVKQTLSRRLTIRIVLILFVLMSGTMYVIYMAAKISMYTENSERYESNLLNMKTTVNHILTEVSVAVVNNEYDIVSSLNNPDELLNIMYRIVEKNDRIKSCGIAFIENYYPKKGKWYIPYAAKNENGEIEKKVIGDKDYDYLSAEWFQSGLAAKEGIWSDPFFDNSDHTTPLVSYLYPIHDKKGNTVAVLGADLSLEWLTQKLKEQDKRDNDRSWALSDSKKYASYSFIIDRKGTYIAHPDSSRILNKKIDMYLAPDDSHFAKIIKEMKEGKNSYEKGKKRFYGDEIVIDSISSTIFYSQLETTKWSMAIVVPNFTIYLTGEAIGILMIFILSTCLLLIFFLCLRVVHKATKPLVQLAATANEVAKGNFNAELPIIKRKDEIKQLRDSFEDMQSSLSSYMERLKETTATKATFENELNIAHNIQMAMLPKTFPPYPERNDIDIYGTLSPAKAVGGDLFDFYIKDDKLLFCIGDVSGKGIPAALVMTVTLALFHSVSSHAPSPDRVIDELNRLMTKGNDNMMFVTLFMGELNLKTGWLRYCNAGHDAPYLIGKKIGRLPCESNIPLGIMAEWQFQLQEIEIYPGTNIFLYTDGLTEAENLEQEQFGKERVVETAQRHIQENEKDAQSLISRMNKAINDFVGEAEQSDDLTMLAVNYKVPKS